MHSKLILISTKSMYPLVNKLKSKCKAIIINKCLIYYKEKHSSQFFSQIDHIHTCLYKGYRIKQSSIPGNQKNISYQES